MNRWADYEYVCPMCWRDFRTSSGCRNHIRTCKGAPIMKVKQQVSYIDRDGARHQAVITGITGVGRSNYKTLNLRYNVAGKPVEVESVPYEADSQEGLGYWLLLGQRRSRSSDDDPTAGSRPMEKETVFEPAVVEPAKSRQLTSDEVPTVVEPEKKKRTSR